MWEDPIVEELRAARDRLAGRFGYDLNALVEYLRGKEREAAAEVVRLNTVVRKQLARGSPSTLQQS